MLYKIALLPILAVTSASQVKHLDDATKAKVLEATRAKLTVPRSFAARVAKYHGNGKTAPTKFDTLEMTEDTQHLRSLKMKDNFVGYTEYTDAACTEQDVTFGTLVNYW